MTRYKQCHLGGTWPVGSVVDESAINPAQKDRLIELGAIEETTDQITHESAIADVSKLEDDELALENARLKSLVADYPQRVASLQAELAKRNDEMAVLQAEHDKQKAAAELAVAKCASAEEQLAANQVIPKQNQKK